MGLFAFAHLSPVRLVRCSHGIPADAVVAQTRGLRSSRMELKYDGFRSLAVIQGGRCQLISRNGHPFSFDSLRKELTVPCSGRTVLDGEIVCVDRRGRPRFNDLLFHRGEPRFFAFDLLMADGQDLRMEKLTDRKQELRRLLSRVSASRLQYVDHVHEHGAALFQRVCEMDLEGIVKAQLRPIRHRAAKNDLGQDQES